MEMERFLAARGRFDAAAREDFPLFFRRVMATVAPGVRYVPNWHVEAIYAHLAACERGEIRRLMIHLPPRMLKSTLVSVAWPAWMLGHQPSQRIMVASYAQSLSIKLSTDCRAVVDAEWYKRAFPGTRLLAGQSEKEKFMTTARGHRIAVSVGGAAIGEGGNVLIVDDPINPMQAGQRVQREAVNSWFEHTFVTRLDDKLRGAIVLVMQRLHADDLSGYLLNKGGWEQLCLPAIAPTRVVISRGDFSYVREAGEPLHATREPVELLQAIQRELGSANFSAQYQQAPLCSATRLVKREWFGRFRAGEPTGDACVQSWDTGVKAGAQHDASACATFVERDGVHQLVDMRVVRMEYPELRRFMVAHAARFSPMAVLIEDKASGQSLLQDLRRESDLPVIACMPDADKVTRFMRVTPLMEAGKFALPDDAPWLAGFEAELLGFPDSAHDDQVDAVSQYFNWVRRRKGPENQRVRVV